MGSFPLDAITLRVVVLLNRRRRIMIVLGVLLTITTIYTIVVLGIILSTVRCKFMQPYSRGGSQF
jgi:hypothetical protein